MSLAKPVLRPASPHFSSGPCAKIPGWTPAHLDHAVLGRSHRAAEGKARLKLAIDLTREVLDIPEDYRIGIVPASDTGAVEMALWSLLGARGVDLLAWESFGEGWVGDVMTQLKLKDARKLTAPYGELPDLSKVDFSRDVVFTWNGTTSGVRVPDTTWIPVDRQGLTICDATSAIFAQELPFSASNQDTGTLASASSSSSFSPSSASSSSSSAFVAPLDVVTFSWQKALGGEAAHGMIVLSPRAVARLESYVPPWPVPKIFRLASKGKLIAGIFEGETINTPSMLCVEDYIVALQWAKRIGGLQALHARADANAAVIAAWVDRTPWVHHLAKVPETRSNTSVCLTVDGDAKAIVQLLEKEGIAYDIGSHRDAPPGLRIWCGSTVETADLEALTPWIDWCFLSS